METNIWLSFSEISRVVLVPGLRKQFHPFKDPHK